MGVVADTNIWSLFLRREGVPPEYRRHVWALRDQIATRQAVLIGPVRQEILSGIPGVQQFVKVRAQIRAIEDEPLLTFDFERAAEFANTCRAVGVQSSPVDMLICAVAERLAAPIYTLDNDFHRYRDLLGIQLFEP